MNDNCLPKELLAVKQKIAHIPMIKVEYNIQNISQTICIYHHSTLLQHISKLNKYLLIYDTVQMIVKEQRIIHPLRSNLKSNWHHHKQNEHEIEFVTLNKIFFPNQDKQQLNGTSKNKINVN